MNKFIGGDTLWFLSELFWESFPITATMKWSLIIPPRGDMAIMGTFCDYAIILSCIFHVYIFFKKWNLYYVYSQNL